MWTWILKNVISYMIGNDVFGKIQKLVSDVALNTELTGSQKREKVLEEAKTFGGNFANHMLSLAVEASVMILKEKASKITTK